MSDFEDLSCFSALSLGRPETPSVDHKVRDENLVCNSLIKSGRIFSPRKSSKIVIQAQDDAQIEESVKQVEIEDPLEVDLDKLSSDKCLSKSATFPFSSGSKCSNDVFDVAEEHKGDSTFQEPMKKGCALSSSPYTHSVSLPTPVKLISALKGSREKLGAPQRNLTVSWAPDVYDPIPTSVSHVPNRRPQRYSNKRNGKNKQKGSGKRGKGKEKKQSRKSGGSSTKHYKLADNESNGTWYGKPQPSMLDFGVGCPDPFIESQRNDALSGGPHSGAVDFGVSNPPFCSHSFLKKSVAPVALPSY